MLYRIPYRIKLHNYYIKDLNFTIYIYVYTSSKKQVMRLRYVDFTELMKNNYY